MCKRILGFRLSCTVVLVWLGYVLSPSQAALSQAKFEALRAKAEQHEKQGQWKEACEVYREILKQDRNRPLIKAQYRKCLRRLYQVRRHTDPTFQKEVLSLPYTQTLKIYSIVVSNLLDSAVEKQKLELENLFRQGLEEFLLALKDPVFRQQYLPNVTASEIDTFQTALLKTWTKKKKITSLDAAIHHINSVALAAQKRLDLRPEVVVLEFACGACNALDDYTVYLTPGQLRELCASLKGETIGVGVLLSVVDNKVVIGEVLPNSPAADNGLERGDQVVSIGKKTTAGLTAAEAMELLDGEEGTLVDLVISRPNLAMPRMVSLRRQALFIRSVPLPEEGEIGYMQISCFQSSTVQEVESALVSLSSSGTKVLILDLRGNGGGLFDVAVEVTKRFIASGVIVYTQTQDSQKKDVHRANNSHLVTIPIVLLVDENTASAAEVLAGALKDHKRATLVGQTTFGKGYSQDVVRLTSAPGGASVGGIRLTVARFFSPNGVSYTGTGVTPHFLVENQKGAAVDHQLDKAYKVAQSLLPK
jgi:carboxyl-terminal processing protease